MTGDHLAGRGLHILHQITKHLDSHLAVQSRGDCGHLRRSHEDLFRLYYRFNASYIATLRRLSYQEPLHLIATPPPQYR